MLHCYKIVVCSKIAVSGYPIEVLKNVVKLVVLFILVSYSTTLKLMNVILSKQLIRSVL